MTNNLFDYLFVLTEESDNEGEEFLVEETSLSRAILVIETELGLKENQYRFIEKMSTEEGEFLGLDTY